MEQNLVVKEKYKIGRFIVYILVEKSKLEKNEE